VTRCHLTAGRGGSQDMIVTEPDTVPVRTRPADVAAASLEHAGLIARGVSFRGPSHELYDEPRQDSFALASSRDRLVVAVSDGIGSSPNSHVGSAAAVQAMANVLNNGSIPFDEVGPILKTASSAVCDAAMAAGYAESSARATLTVVVIEADAQQDGSRRAWLHGVGDSPAFLLDPSEGIWSQVTPTDDGPANRVHSWVPDGIDDHFSMGLVIPTGQVLVVSTDGFSGALGETLGRSLAELWQRPPDVFAFGRHLGFDHGFDDKTVVAVWNFPVSDR
jgi:hypothetical protein